MNAPRRSSPGPSRPLPKAHLLLALAGLTWSTGCADLLGEQDQDGYFRVAPKSDGTFFGWTEIHVDQDPYSVDKATLTRAALEAREGAKDMTFMTHVVGEAVTPEKRTPVARGSKFPPNETIAEMSIIYEDDLRPLFVLDEDGDGGTIRIEWNGTVDPNYTEWPEDGYEVGVFITVELD